MKGSLFENRIRTRSCTLVTSNKSLLLVKQIVPTREKPIWLPPGGEVLFGEKIRDAAQRETREETGLEVVPSDIAAIHEFIEPPFHALEIYFFAAKSGGSLFTGTDPEFQENDQKILDAAFINYKHLSTLPVYPFFIKNFEACLGGKKCDNGPRFFSTPCELR